ncbi:MAG: efflux RND transporter periplasmic adaptor subunit [Candidatus Binatia bacterium]
MRSKQGMILVAAVLAGGMVGSAVTWLAIRTGRTTEAHDVGGHQGSTSTESRELRAHQDQRDVSPERNEVRGGPAGAHSQGELPHAGTANGGEVHLTPGQIERLGIRVERLKAGTARTAITRPATVAFDLDRVARVGPRIAAKVVSVTKDLGTAVKKGEVVAILTSVQLGLAQTRYVAARARLETQRRAYAREQDLYEKHVSSEASMLEARARYGEAEAKLDAARDTLRLYGWSAKEIEALHRRGRHPLSYLYLTSPINGVIQRRDLAPGDTVEPNQTPIHVVDTSRLWVMIDAFERDVPRLATGQKIELRVQSLPGRTFRGTVDWISQELKKDTRTVDVRAAVANPERLLRAGMFGTARIATGRSADTALAPVDAIQTLGAKQVVFVAGDEAGSFKPAPVILGEEAGGLVEIASGVQPGQQVVTEGAFALKSAFTASSRSADD